MLDYNQLSEEQKQIVREYQAIHSRLHELEEQMKTLSAEAKQLIGQLEALRQKDKKINNNGEK